MIFIQKYTPKKKLKHLFVRRIASVVTNMSLLGSYFDFLKLNAFALAGKLNVFLQFNQKDNLQNEGKVTTANAKVFAESTFEKYRIIQDNFFEDGFDRIIKRIEKE